MTLDSPHELRLATGSPGFGKHTFHRRPGACTHAAAGLGALILCLSGCAGGARITLIPLSSSSLTLQSRLQYSFTPQRCYWWKDEQDRLCISMSDRNLSIAGNYTRRSLELSLILDDAALDSDKPYQANRETARAIWHQSAWHLRMRTRRGRIVIEKTSENTLSGKFHLDCACEEFNVLLGWQRRSPVLVRGQFTAVKNSAKGWEILETTEVDNARRRDTGGVTFWPGG